MFGHTCHNDVSFDRMVRHADRVRMSARARSHHPEHVPILVQDCIERTSVNRRGAAITTLRPRAWTKRLTPTSMDMDTFVDWCALSRRVGLGEGGHRSVQIVLNTLTSDVACEYCCDEDPHLPSDPRARPCKIGDLYTQYAQSDGFMYVRTIDVSRTRSRA